MDLALGRMSVAIVGVLWFMSTFTEVSCRCGGSSHLLIKGDSPVEAGSQANVSSFSTAWRLKERFLVECSVGR